MTKSPDLAPLSDETSTTSTDSQLSTTPVQSAVTRKRARRTTDTLSSTPKSRRVRFAQETRIYSSPYNEVDTSDAWYTEAEYTAFRHATIAIGQQQDGARPWLQELVAAYRALRDATQAQQVYQVFRESGRRDEEQQQVTDVPALYLGMEMWVLSRSLERNKRRQDILNSIQYWQASIEAPAGPRRGQIRKASLAISRPAGMLAVYIARRLAQSVQQEQQQD